MKKARKSSQKSARKSSDQTNQATTTRERQSKALESRAKSASKSAKSENDLFPIVGVGASAGGLEAFKPENRKVFAFSRNYLEETVLCVFNLAQSAQPVELDLSDHVDCTPIELLGGARFPLIGAAPYQLALGPRSFYWFLLSRGQ